MVSTSNRPVDDVVYHREAVVAVTEDDHTQAQVGVDQHEAAITKGLSVLP